MNSAAPDMRMPGLSAEQLAIQDKLAAANINPDSFLATDYLNHYNEIVMLLEMLPDMPDMLEEALEWEPKTYVCHFKDSQFQAKNLAVEAYHLAPVETRSALDTVCHLLDQTINQTLFGMKKVAADSRGLSDSARLLLQNRVEAIQSLLMKLNQVIHGKHGEAFLNDLNAVTSAPQTPDPEADQGKAQSQADIDKLFD